jgi:hypothetical protein
VTDAERRAARAAVLGGADALTLAFGRRDTDRGPGAAWRQRVGECSALGVELHQVGDCEEGQGRGREAAPANACPHPHPTPPTPCLLPARGQAAAAVRAVRREAEARAEAEAYPANPDAAFWAPAGGLPPPPGVAAALAACRAPAQAGEAGALGRGGGSCSAGSGGAGGASWSRGASKGSGRQDAGARPQGRDVLVLNLHHGPEPAGAGGGGSGARAPRTPAATVQAGAASESGGHATATLRRAGVAGAELLGTWLAAASEGAGTAFASRTRAGAAPLATACGGGGGAPAWAVTSVSVRM